MGGARPAAPDGDRAVPPVVQPYPGSSDRIRVAAVDNPAVYCLGDRAAPEGEARPGTERPRQPRTCDAVGRARRSNADRPKPPGTHDARKTRPVSAGDAQ